MAIFFFLTNSVAPPHARASSDTLVLKWTIHSPIHTRSTLSPRSVHRSLQHGRQMTVYIHSMLSILHISVFAIVAIAHVVVCASLKTSLESKRKKSDKYYAHFDENERRKETNGFNMPCEYARHLARAGNREIHNFQ